MRYLTLVIIILLSLTIPLAAQDNDSTPYEIALERITEAEATNATVLDLNSLGLTEVPPEIGNLSNLQVLDLSHNQLSTLPPEMGNLSSLLMMNLSNNNLRGLPPEIGNLSNLYVLDLAYNQLNNLPSEIGNLSSLRVLDLAYNQLNSLPPEISNLSNLLELYLDNNQLSSLPPEIGNLSDLICVLHIEDNQLRHLPTELGQLQNLAAGVNCLPDITGGSGLHVDGNPLISPPPEVFAEGTGAILAYLRHQAWWHLQRMVISIASVVGGIVLFILSIRWRNRRHRKPKQKRG